jgi:hypothetical protein
MADYLFSLSARSFAGFPVFGYGKHTVCFCRIPSGAVILPVVPVTLKG